MDNRSTAWSITINNPTSTDEEQISIARQKGWKVEGQLEQGTEGTPHYQLLVRTPQVRFSAVKKAFPRGHIEVARNVQALQNYVIKEDTRLQSLPVAQDKYPSMSKLWDLVYEYLSAHNDDCWNEDGTLFVSGSKEKRENLLTDWFDDAINYLIRQGYYVESMAVNPQVRSAWSKYAKSLMIRSATSVDNRQTDNLALEQSVLIPALEHNHADEKKATCPPPPPPPPPPSGWTPKRNP